MYVTRVMDGRAYQAFVPSPIIPPIPTEQLKNFAEIDSWLGCTLDEKRFMERAAYSIAKMDRRMSSPEQFQLASKAIEFALKSKSFGCKQIKQVNSILTGSGTTGFRQKPGWVGAPHPSMAWHVGSPPEMVDKMMKTLMQSVPAGVPASIYATIRLFRVLQIHPFSDGNGRTARLVAIRTIHERIGTATGILELIDRLWDRSKSNISTVSLAAQSDGDFTEIFEHVWRTANKAIKKID